MVRPRRTVLLVATTATLVTLAACASKQEQQAELANGDDPMKALTAEVESTRYGTAFWAQQSDSNTTLWQNAKSYCQQNGVTSQGQKVNCAAVMTVAGTETIRHPERRKPGTMRY